MLIKQFSLFCLSPRITMKNVSHCCDLSVMGTRTEGRWISYLPAFAEFLINLQKIKFFSALALKARKIKKQKLLYISHLINSLGIRSRENLHCDTKGIANLCCSPFAANELRWEFTFIIQTEAFRLIFFSSLYFNLFVFSRKISVHQKSIDTSNVIMSMLRINTTGRLDGGFYTCQVSDLVIRSFKKLYIPVELYDACKWFCKNFTLLSSRLWKRNFCVRKIVDLKSYFKCTNTKVVLQSRWHLKICFVYIYNGLEALLCLMHE